MLKFLFVSVLALASREQGAHVHGQGHMNLAFDGKKGRIEMEIPGDSLFGFEHEAKSKTDKARKEAALKKLQDKAGEMVKFEDALGCVVKLESYQVNQEKNHADVDISFDVSCQKEVLGSKVEFFFQRIFSRLKKVKVDVVADGSQKAETVQKSLDVSKDGESLELK